MTYKQCPRCGKQFVCFHDDDILSCPCSQIRLTEGARTYIRSRFEDCLCCACLQEIVAQNP